MTREEIQRALNEKLDRGYEAFREAMLARGADIVFDCADEIHANQQVYEELYSSTHHTGYLEYLLRYEDPLEVMRDHWLDHNNVSIRDDFSYALWSLSGQKDYALEEAHLQKEPEPAPGQEQQM